MLLCVMANFPLRMIGKPVDAAGGADSSFIDKMKARKKKVVVFYGSQTGTAEEFAARLAKDATRQGLPAMTFDPEDCSDWVSYGTPVCLSVCLSVCMYVCTCMCVCIYLYVHVQTVYSLICTQFIY